MHRIVMLMVLLAGATAQADEMKLVADGPLANTTTRDDWLAQDHKDKYYTENWMTMLRSEKGHVLYVNFLRTNIGVFEGGAGVSVSLTLPKQQAKHLAFEHKVKDFSCDRETRTIHIGPNSLRLDGKDIYLVVKEPGFELDLKLHAWTPGIKFHGGRTTWGSAKKWMEVFVHAPRATVTGHMILGDTRVPILGEGYVDHLRQNILGSEYASRWFVNRFFHVNWGLVLISFRTPEKHGGQWVHRLILIRGDSVLVHTNDINLEPSDSAKDPRGHNYHRKYGISFQGGGIGIEAVAQGKEVHDRDAMLERMSKAQAGVVKMVAGNPITYRMIGTTNATITLPGAAPVTIRGESFLESVVLKDE
ncbi:MAG: hypothetical protein FJ098_11015 [Deltaproteobacteria bacterium]|nr:hypothetical protein [Deltaproteobacteria bacterium]